MVSEKKIIYYARTYRHLKSNFVKNIIYMLLLVLPCLVLLILNLQNLTGFISETGVKILGRVFPGIPMYIDVDEFSILGMIEYIDMPTVYPDFPFVLLNLGIVLVMIFLLGSGKRKGTPLTIYFMLSIITHVVNCVYFIFAANHFPYLASQYSNLYMKQQIGIWLTFIVMSGMVTCIVGSRGYLYKAITFFAIIGYSLLFGSVRYILFLYLLQQFSILYMALMFFVFGPLFDFLYLVSIYSIFINKMVKIYNHGKGREDWLW